MSLPEQGRDRENYSLKSRVFGLAGLAIVYLTGYDAATKVLEKDDGPYSAMYWYWRKGRTRLALKCASIVCGDLIEEIPITLASRWTGADLVVRGAEFLLKNVNNK